MPNFENVPKGGISQVSLKGLFGSERLRRKSGQAFDRNHGKKFKRDALFCNPRLAQGGEQGKLNSVCAFVVQPPLIEGMGVVTFPTGADRNG